MNATQLPFLVEGILVLATIILGILLGRAAKPYGRVKLVIHLFLFVWLTVGVGFISYGLLTINVMKLISISVAIMSLMILTQLITGIIMLASKKVGKTLPMIHVSSAILLVLSDISAFIIAGVRS
ncbi:MAG TPA: hypothetical protein VK821_01400 [Dehalococcoidia bacterium]|nr:hypothetical protein [Dehalococcoidia bacterium]